MSGSSNRRGTSYDVARLAGVSQSAVSRCFRPGGSVAPATRARILAAAATLGYRPNAIAQGLITRRSNMVAVIISNLTNLHYPEVLAELTMQLSSRGMRVLLFTLQAESEIDRVIDQVWRYQVDGAIIAARLFRDQVDALARARIPAILYNRELSDGSISAVMCDSGAGEAVLIDRIHAAGARRFGIIAGPEDSTVGQARVRGAIRRLGMLGIADVPVVAGDFSYDAGRDGANRLLAGQTLDAIIAVNDVTALGAMDCVRFDHKLRVPEDISIAGFDGVEPAHWQSYALTTVRQPVQRMAEAAVSMLVERIEDPAIGPERRLFSGDLIAGKSARLG